jgi:Na+/H+-translocating membrane pyrophosphatase
VALYPVFGLNGIMFPMVARALGLIASIIGIMTVRGQEDEDPMTTLNRGFYITTGLAAVGFFLATAAAHGTMPKNISKSAFMAASGQKPIKPPWLGTLWGTRSKTRLVHHCTC